MNGRTAEFEKHLERLTEDDAGYRNCRDEVVRQGRPPLSLEDYRDFLRFCERDEWQMTDMGR